MDQKSTGDFDGEDSATSTRTHFALVATSISFPEDEQASAYISGAKPYRTVHNGGATVSGEVNGAAANSRAI